MPITWKSARGVLAIASLIAASCSMLLCVALATTVLRIGLVHSCRWGLVISLAIALVALPRRQAFAAIALLVIALVVAGDRLGVSGPYGPNNLETSLDGRYYLTEFVNYPLVAMPGQGGDAPGYVQLRKADGTIVAEAPFGMEQDLGEMEWHPDRVEIGPHGGGHITWQLP